MPLPGMGNPPLYSGGSGNDLYQPSGTTRLLAIGFKSDASTFTDNSISGAISGISRNSGNGPDGNAGYGDGWGAAAGISHTSQDLWGNARTFICWYKGSQTNAASGYQAGVIFFAGFGWAGLDAGKVAANNDGGAVTSTGSSIADGNWHMIAYSTPGTSVAAPLKAYLDGTYLTDLNEGADSSNYPYTYVGRVGGNATAAAYPTALAGIQIYSGQLSDAQILEIYNGVIG